MINLSGKTNGIIHNAWRISYTHVDGEIAYTEICYERAFRSETLEDYFERCAGIAKIDCEGIPVFHDSLCRFAGEIPEDDWGYAPKEFKWSRKG